MFIFSLIVAVGVFVGFLSLVGSPSEIETIIGLILGVLAFLLSLVLCWKAKSAAHEENQNGKIAELEKQLADLKKK